jgi:hypothetical protein
MSGLSCCLGMETSSSNKGFIMLCIEYGIYGAIERGIEQEYGMDITAMIAILHEEITSDAILEDLEKKYPIDWEGHKPYVRPIPEERFEDVIAWVTEHFAQAGLLPQKNDLNALLRQFFAQWETMPIILPLVS